LKPDDLNKKIYEKSVVVPAKNEEKNLMPLFERLAKTNLEAEYILVCAESKDKTLEAAYEVKDKFKNMNINVFEQKSNGKANAVFEGFEYSNGEVISILDSDISVDPERLVDFFEIIENSNADFVNGTRMIYPMEKNAMRYLNKLGNNFFQYFISKVIFYNLSDSLCGTKVFKKSSLENLKEWRFSQRIFDPFGDFDMIFNAAYEGATIVEIPVHYRSRIYGKTQISRFRDGFKLIIYFLASFKKLNSSKYSK
jgi:glycosyltransferase involved in cell wall biosynthesis